MLRHKLKRALKHEQLLFLLVLHCTTIIEQQQHQQPKTGCLNCSSVPLFIMRRLQIILLINCLISIQHKIIHSILLNINYHYTTKRKSEQYPRTRSLINRFFLLTNENFNCCYLDGMWLAFRMHPQRKTSNVFSHTFSIYTRQ